MIKYSGDDAADMALKGEPMTQLVVRHDGLRYDREEVNGEPTGRIIAAKKGESLGRALPEGPRKVWVKVADNARQLRNGNLLYACLLAVAGVCGVFSQVNKSTEAAIISETAAQTQAATLAQNEAALAQTQQAMALLQEEKTAREDLAQELAEQQVLFAELSSQLTETKDENSALANAANIAKQTITRLQAEIESYKSGSVTREQALNDVIKEVERSETALVERVQTIKKSKPKPKPIVQEMREIHEAMEITAADQAAVLEDREVELMAIFAARFQLEESEMRAALDDAKEFNANLPDRFFPAPTQPLSPSNPALSN